MGLTWSFVGLAAAACIAYPWLHPLARGSSPTIEPLLVGLACTAVLLALAALSGPGATLARGMLCALAAAAAAVWVGDIVARGTAAPSPGAVSGWIVLAGVAACAAVGSLAHAGRPGWSASTIAWAWLIAGLLSTAIALAQAAGVADLLGTLAAQSPNRQAFANLRQKNHYATLANIALLATVWLVLHGRPALPRGAAAAAALFLCTGVAATASRTGALQMLAVLLLAALWHRRAGQPARWLALPLVAYLGAALVLLAVMDPGGRAGPAILSRLADAAPNCTSRTVLWQNMAQLVMEKPWTGWGWRELSFAFYQGDYEPRFCALLENAHNLPLHLAVELGLPVAVLACVLLAWALLRARPWRETRPAAQLGWAVLLLLSLHSLVEYPLWYAPFQMALGLSLGLVANEGGGLKTRRGVLGAWALAFLGFAAYAAWDHYRVSQLYLAPAARSAAYRDDTLLKARKSWLYAEHVDFAELSTIPLVGSTAPRLHELAGRLLHFSPEPRVIEKRIHSALRLGLEAEAAQEMRRYRAAYPAEYEAWRASQAPRR